MQVVDEILKQRGAEYGQFKDHAALSQELKAVINNALATRKKTLEPDMAEALSMIIHKIARIINGNASSVDQWVDIAGYSTLVADRLQGKVQ
jgi:uncharacterized ferritin-like protein (DUF455 family)